MKCEKCNKTQNLRWSAYMKQWVCSKCFDRYMRRITTKLRILPGGKK